MKRSMMGVVTFLVWVVPGDGAPPKPKCVLGDGLLNPLTGKGVHDTEDNAAEEDVLGWAGDSTDAVAQLAFIEGNLTDQQLKDCLEDYKTTVTSSTSKPLPPGVLTDNDPSRQQYLPFTSGKDEAVGAHGEYYTTYDGSHYRFKEKGYVIDPPEDLTPPSTPLTEAPSPKTTRKPSHKSKDELKLWYNAFVSVVSKYV
ncbi:hypothetical protein GE061_015847 [Apolygus lucorum]|uniref:Uncharacterized protein n=1 Tax=Apolygus lucorum TaxID=248454 RepID=A0A6A4JHW0_APOLU|nr:hypothetical protein GE061_015847 [Apolygus lucorum]